MKVATLLLNSFYIAIYRDGTEKEVSIRLVTGCWEMCFYLEQKFGIQTVPSTVYNGKKRFEPTKFEYFESKEDVLGYLNWVLNFPHSEREKFYNNEPDKSKFTKNNPIVDLKITARKHIKEPLNK